MKISLFRHASAVLIGTMMMVLCSFSALAVTNYVIQVSFNDGFSPSYLKVAVGDTVTFVRVAANHTVTGTGSDPFCGSNYLLDDRNPTCPPAGSPAHTMSSIGVFPYRCLFHASMLGNIEVVAAANNGLPTVIVTQPTNGGAIFSPPTNTFSASATDVDGTIKKVEFFYGTNPNNVTNSLGTSTNGTNGIFFIQVTNTLPIGNLKFSATATDDRNGQGFSDQINVVVGPRFSLDRLLLSSTQFQFHLASSNGFKFVLQGSTNLTNWSNLLTNTVSTNGLNFIDTSFATNLLQFYRVRFQP